MDIEIENKYIRIGNTSNNKCSKSKLRANFADHFCNKGAFKFY